MKRSWTCKCCGQIYDTLPLSYASKAPDNWFGLPEAERASRATLTDDLCIIDERERYVLGCLEVPVEGLSEPFVWTVWVSVSAESLRYIVDNGQAEISPDEPPRFGWLSTWINGYPKPIEIKCHVFLRSGSLRPRIVLEPTDYPLAVEQHDGITLDRVEQIAATFIH